MTSQTGVPISVDYFILSLMRLDRDHYQRIEAVRSVTGDDMEHFLFAPNGELEDLILDYLGFPADGTPIKGGGIFSRNAWDWEYHEMLEGIGELDTDKISAASEAMVRANEHIVRATELIRASQ